MRDVGPFLPERTIAPPIRSKNVGRSTSRRALVPLGKRDLLATPNRMHYIWLGQAKFWGTLQ